MLFIKQTKVIAMFFKRLRYLMWKNWYLSCFPRKSPSRFIGETRVVAVYDPAFKEGGMKKVKEIHNKHIKELNTKLSGHRGNKENE